MKRMKHVTKLLREIDWPIIVNIILIFAFGIMMLTSATHANKSGGSRNHSQNSNNKNKVSDSTRNTKGGQAQDDTRHINKKRANNGKNIGNNKRAKDGRDPLKNPQILEQKKVQEQKKQANNGKKKSPIRNKHKKHS